ncbi:short-chain collagen C4-like [Mercenaria mercenaria]|uniref:short-chain collagen C4-like n=1 Tax=Mercenaria mercenaria TaxID=6596 RepID=UPI00234EA0E2|nr:short-chain collagen C4-like [Mercenaria mercenaria]
MLSLTMARHRMLTFLSILLILQNLGLGQYEEPECVSSFHSNYHMLQKIVQLEQKLINLEAENTKQQHLIDRMTTEGAGSVYVRWGRNSCPQDATLVYKGYTGGKYYNEAGSGSDTLCLPSDPTWSNYTDGNASCCRGHVYGSEIHVEEPSKIFPYKVRTQDMPCAVCKTLKSTTLMVPARSNCYPDWKLEYTGYIMANHYVHAGPHNHICVDSQPEFVPNGGEYKLHHLLYLMEAQCGSLPCPPYVQGRELACVVCSL